METEQQRDVLTKRELNLLANMMTIFFHAGERILSVIQMSMEKEYRMSDDYKKIKKHIGKLAADEFLKKQATKVLRHDHRLKYGEIIRRIDQLKTMMDAVTNDMLACTKEGYDMMESYDAIHKDTNWLCKFYSLMQNITTDEDLVKLESMIKLYAKGDVISENILSNFNDAF